MDDLVRQGGARGLRLLSGAILLVGLLLGLSGPAVAQTAPVNVPLDANGMPTITWFPETGHHLAEHFLTSWNSTGLMIFGYPISEPLTENGRLVQYFERARLEYWPENSGQWIVQGTLLGNWKAEKLRQTEPAFRPLPSTAVSDSPDRLIFQETGHSLAYGFLQYWKNNGGLWQFGYPISEEFQERNPQDGKVYTVQYFERARFEYHPEHAGTPFEVLLGHLGREYAAAKKVDTDPVPQRTEAPRYDVGLFDGRFEDAFRPAPGRWQGFVSSSSAAIRNAPSQSATVLDWVYWRRPIMLQGMVKGELVDGSDAWYVVGDGQYIPAAHIDPLVLPTPPRTFAGHWVDVNLSRFYAIAYDGATPAYVAIIAAGRDGKTPTGVFNIMYQVRYETMDSSTVGIPPGAPGYYYLENVPYTSYFLDGGYAIHGNYWTPEERFGNFTSNGCVGLMEPDAAYFWYWLNVGDVVSIHY